MTMKKTRKPPSYASIEALPTHRLNGGDETDGDVHGGCGGEYDEDEDGVGGGLEVEDQPMPAV